MICPSCGEDRATDTAGGEICLACGWIRPSPVQAAGFQLGQASGLISELTDALLASSGLAGRYTKLLDRAILFVQELNRSHESKGS